MYKQIIITAVIMGSVQTVTSADEWWKPYSPPCTERENVFEFTEKPKVRKVAEDRYEITFAVKGYCDVTVAVIDPDPKRELVPGRGIVVRHLGAGVLGPNAPAPFQKNSLKQVIYWDGKDDLGFYHKTPEKLQVRVSLGLKPVFDKRLGGTSPKNLPGTVQGMAAGPDGVYIIWNGTCGGFGSASVRKFDHDGNYIATLVPPPANLPESKLSGMGYVEYEPGKKTVHGPDINQSVAVSAFYLPPLDADDVESCQPVIAGNRLVFPNGGFIYASPGSFLHYIYTDGGRDELGIRGLSITKHRVVHQNARLAVSPDGKKIYISGTASSDRTPSTSVYVRMLDSDEEGKVFVGETGKPGSDEYHLNNADGIDCDSEGRVYIADLANNRIQVFSPEGKFLKTISVDRPSLVQVHKKTGAIYVLHTARVEGRSVGRLTKFTSFKDPREEFHQDGFQGLMVLDSWTAQPRLWFGGRQGKRAGHADSASTVYTGTGSVTIWEEREKKLVKIADFEEEAKKEAGKSWAGRWNGVNMHILSFANATCDPTREKMYYRYKDVFNLVTGEREGTFVALGGCFQDIGFDRRGYMHGHQNNRAGIPCVWRVDPSLVVIEKDKEGDILLKYPEVPYDYGVEVSTGGWHVKTWKGAIATKCQAGAKGFQDGMGVNMKGDIVVGSNIYYVPKMEEAGKELALAGSSALTSSGRYNEEGLNYERFLRSVQDAERKGESVYFIKRQAGIPLSGATLWKYDRSGEVCKESPAVAGGLIAGAQIDEDGFVYVVMDKILRRGGKIFLADRAGHFGIAKKETPFTGILVKTRIEKLKILLKNAIVPMGQLPGREPDFSHPDGWIEGAEWIYAGASPIVPGGCSCPSSRFHLDWYKRVYVPEMYRHSIGILDTNGNLITHSGRYGNFDDAPGGKNGCKPGSEEICFIAPRYIGGTDNYLAIPDWGEKIVVLKLDYHTEASTEISFK